ncbi:LysM peptidoglycan-binding domain-containing protein [Thermospira aquatica]|uniref:DUF4398 domain-containing protein n=1 Tax=Thermospira aquatica TaxID=2828656 RepID=A0AAX3BBS5_9SPIR|nr:LysM peptidoglycan-binding domain-containing protein [Thermospira aquatica]URA09742.1 DUF4398 domain-containing protein [Thermospira aquatica]
MRKLLVTLSIIGMVLWFAGCSSVPKKELEEAKKAIEQAQAVDAALFASSELAAAQNDYDAANKFVENKKNKEAKEKAVSSKQKADEAYSLARERRAEDIYQKNVALMNQIKENFGEKRAPEAYEDAVSSFNAFEQTYAKKDPDATYQEGSKLYEKLSPLAQKLLADVEQATAAVTAAQDKYYAAENRDIVKTYASKELSDAAVILQRAKEALANGDLEEAISLAQQASALIDGAITKAEQAYQQELASQQQVSPAEGNINTNKQKAEQYIDEAKKKLEELKKRRGSSYLPLEASFTYVAAGEGEEEVNDAMVEKYIKLAEDAYAREEYLDAIDYAREAIRLADMLLAMETAATYTVKLNPANRDCLWKIAGYMYNNRYWLWPMIWRANKYQIKDPDLIYPGQVFKIPPMVGEGK